MEVWILEQSRKSRLVEKVIKNSIYFEVENIWGICYLELLKIR
jgi:hypothetical protein